MQQRGAQAVAAAGAAPASDGVGNGGRARWRLTAWAYNAAIKTMSVVLSERSVVYFVQLHGTQFIGGDGAGDGCEARRQQQHASEPNNTCRE